jgi:16S rRNA (cytidine1402-2'-O)-methyltransferase
MRIFACGTQKNMSTLFIVSTPIGNLSDITLRALDILKSVSLIISEDTRETAKILQKYNIENAQISYRDQNHDRVWPTILSTLQQGKDIALVSDSGTPLISDPGFKLVRDLIKENIKIESVPGPSAIIASLTISGLPTDKFTFLGFLPRTASHRKGILNQYGALDSTLIIYESPFRVRKLLEEINETLGNRDCCVIKDITKIYESVVRGKVTEIIEHKEINKNKGEFVVLVGKEGLHA